MKKKIAYDRWRKIMMQIIVFCIIILFMVEMVLYIFLNKQGLVAIDARRYMMKYAFFPTGFNLLVWYVSSLCVRRETFSWRAKNYALIICLSLVCFCVAWVHNFFLVTICFFGLPIVLSGIFGDDRLTWHTTLLCIGLMMMTGWLPLYENSHRDELFVFNMVIALIYLLITSVFTKAVNSINRSMMRNLRDSYQQIQDVEEELLQDRLTGLYNHAGFYRLFEEQLNKCRKARLPISLVVVDIDDFKKVNDTYGHENGNVVLVQLARVLKEVCGENGYVCRYGGEEFAIIFPSFRDREAYQVMEEARQKFADCRHPFLPAGNVTFSAGVRQWAGETSPQLLFVKADKAMYMAKKGGKNRCYMG